MVWGGGVEGCQRAGFSKDSCREKAVPESTGPCPEAPEAPPGGQEVKQSVMQLVRMLSIAHR